MGNRDWGIGNGDWGRKSILKAFLEELSRRRERDAKCAERLANS